MLKTQLSSKLFPLYARWGEVEDILTGDYFGALDYLPRRPFLAEFITHITRLNRGCRLGWHRVQILAHDFYEG